MVRLFEIDFKDFKSIIEAFKSDKYCYLTNVVNGVTKRLRTADMVNEIGNIDHVVYKTNFSWKRRYSSIDAYIYDDEEKRYWIHLSCKIY